MRDKKILGFYHPKGLTLAGVKNLASLQIDEICSYSVQKRQTWPPQAILFSDWSISKKNLLLCNRLGK
jgi:hypothetical protein